MHLAKELATLDVLSRGRLVAGLGVGHLVDELRALGVPERGRGKRAEEYLAAMRALWTMPEPRFAGRHVSFDGVDAYPKPVRPGGPPLVLGGAGGRALRRMESADLDSVRRKLERNRPERLGLEVSAPAPAPPAAAPPT